MGENGDGDEKGLKSRRLVDWSCKEKERFAGGDGLSYERDERGISDVESKKERGWVGRIFLDRRYCNRNGSG